MCSYQQHLTSGAVLCLFFWLLSQSYVLVALPPSLALSTHACSPHERLCMWACCCMVAVSLQQALMNQLIVTILDSVSPPPSGSFSFLLCWVVRWWTSCFQVHSGSPPCASAQPWVRDDAGQPTLLHRSTRRYLQGITSESQVRTARTSRLSILASSGSDTTHCLLDFGITTQHVQQVAQPKFCNPS